MEEGGPGRHGPLSVRDAIEQDILDEVYAAGEHLEETKLAEKYGVSRTPVRAALRTLAEAGLVETIPNRGSFVRRPSTADLIEMMEVLDALEEGCASLAVRRILPHQLESMIATCEDYANEISSGALDRALEEHDRFRAFVLDACGNRFLQKKISALTRILKPYRRLMLNLPSGPARTLKAQHELLEAFRGGDADHARKVMRASAISSTYLLSDFLAAVRSRELAQK